MQIYGGPGPIHLPLSVRVSSRDGPTSLRATSLSRCLTDARGHGHSRARTNSLLQAEYHAQPLVTDDRHVVRLFLAIDNTRPASSSRVSALNLLRSATGTSSISLAASYPAMEHATHTMRRVLQRARLCEQSRAHPADGLIGVALSESSLNIKPSRLLWSVLPHHRHK